MVKGLRNNEKIQDNWSARALIVLPLSLILFGFLMELNDPEGIKRLNDSGAEVVTSKSPEEFAAFMKAEGEKWAKLVKALGLVSQ